MKRRIVTVALSLLAALASLPALSSPDRANPAEVLAKSWKDAGQTEVLVLGTAHLSSLDDAFRPESLRSLHNALTRFRPDRIVIEQLPPDALVALERRTDPAARQILDMFGTRILSAGKAAQAQLKLTQEDARRAAAEHLAQPRLTDTERGRLVGELLASYDYASAVLHWQVLGEAARKALPLPSDVVQALEKSASSPNEIYSIAVPLAAKLGLARLDPVDDHSDGLAVLSWPEARMLSVFEHPLKKAIAKEPWLKEAEKRLRTDNAKGSLSEYYRWLNSAAYHRVEMPVTWGPFLRMDNTEGYGRARLALWELRNAKIAANIAAVSAQPGVKRVLVIYGNAHKPFLDAALAASTHVKLRQLEELLPAAP